MNKLLFILFIFIGCSSFGAIDSLRLDELKKKLKSNLKIEEKIQTYIDLGILLEGKDFVGSIAYADTAVTLAKKHKKDKQLAEAVIVLGNDYWYLGDTDKSMKLYLQSLKIREKIKDVRGIGISKYNISLLFNALGNNEESIRYGKESIEQFQSPDLVDDLCIGYIHLTNLYNEMDSTEKAKLYFKKAELLLPKLKDNGVIASFYLQKGAYFKNDENLDSALINYKTSLQYDSLANNTYGMTAVLNNIGLLYAQMDQMQKAIYYTEKSAELSILHNIKLSLKYSYGNLADYHAEIGEFEKSCSYMRKYDELNRQLYSEDNQRIGNEMEAKFQDEKKMLIIEKQQKEGEAKDAKIAQQDEETKRKNQQLIFIGVGLVLMLFITINIFRNLQRKKRDNALITAQKEEIIHQKEELQEKHNEIKDSIDYAKRIQTALLTSDEFWNEISTDHFVLFQPKDVVSGDFFWAFQAETTEGKLAIWCAADCTGHGVPGAFMSMLGISFLNEIVVERKVTDAVSILEMLRERIINALIQKKAEIKQRDGMDIALCVWNKSTNILEYAGANNPLWILRRNKGQGTGDKGEENTTTLLEFKPDKMPVGQYGDELEPFTKQSIQLEKGDIIYTFSDGYADQFGGPNGKKLRSANFKNLLLECSNLTGSEQKTILAEKFSSWKGKIEQIDDVCVIGVRI